MTKDSYFVASAKCFVTYMSADTLSVAFEQTLKCDQFVNSSVYSVNIDMKTGNILKNTDIINTDEAFAADFRERSEKQNGGSKLLEGMTDKQLLSALQSEDSLIIMYTPMGMEIGVNGESAASDSEINKAGWVTVTYKDYKSLLKQ